MAYLDDLRDGLYDQMVDMLVANNLKYDPEFRKEAEENGFDFDQMIEDAKAQIPDEVEDLW